MTKVLRAENLVKKYGDFYAVNDIDLNLNKGEVVGLLGPNGGRKDNNILYDYWYDKAFFR